MNLQLSSHVAVIAGAAQGIGRAIAHAFAAEGAAVALLDRAPSLTDTAAELANSGASVLPLLADVTDLPRVRSAADEVLGFFGRVDHVVFAVAVGSGKYGFPFWNLEPSDWPNVLQVNVVGAVNVAHAFAPALLKRGPGATLLFLASVAGQIGSQTDPPYSASKAALINFAQCAARDFAPHGVRVNALCPGMVKTALNRAVWEAWANRQPEGQRLSYEEWADDKVRRVVPLGRWQAPEDVAAMAVFLASARAANVTGQTINVDGGYVMRS
jgi:NAD(P)-dependent dehydrogenase (short-subunit alcohol dehydrogenase family)